MHFVYLLARIYPYWALPCALIFAQLFYFFRRRNSPLRFSVLGCIVFLMGGLIAWIVFRGDLHSDHWVRAVVGD